MKKIMFFIIITGFILFCSGLLIFGQSNYLKILSPSNGWSSARVIDIRGETNTVVQTVNVVYNGIPLHLPVSNGVFQRKFVAAPGLNSIYAEIRTDYAILTDSVTFYSKAPAKAMKVVLTWDTDKTDVDLWIIEPTGEKCFYIIKNTKIGGSLDVDVTTGYGPEVYTLAAPTKGDYKIQIHYFSDNNLPQTEAKVYIVLYEGSPNEVFKEYETMLTKTGNVVTVDVVSLD